VNPYYEDGGLRLFHGDNREVLKTFADNTFDSIVTDPPYELGFMGKGWDSSGIAYDVDMWRECLRVLKPGGFLLSFGGTRTWHRIAVAIEDAGFEVRDSMAWLYGSGFPKSMNVSAAIDKHLGHVRTERGEIKPGHEAFVGRDNLAGLRDGSTVGTGEGGYARPWMNDPQKVEDSHFTFLPVAPEATEFEGWGTALKPAFEPIVVARKPLIGTVAVNMLAHGTGGLNIDATRVQTYSDGPGSTPKAVDGGKRNAMSGDMERVSYDGSKGRFPTNVLLDESQAAVLDEQAPDTGGSGKASGPSRREPTAAGVAFGARRGLTGEPAFYGGEKGGASRFFPTFRYEAKAPGSERPEVDGVAHATVKPLDLMRWLVRLVTRRGGHVLDPFAGSGTTGEAALLEGMDSTLIELESDHLPLILQRVHKPLQPSMFGDWDGDAA
jgi:site-specific DNA-methyltransferase (adenine-specific)